jgi:hypothetical protein
MSDWILSIAAAAFVAGIAATIAPAGKYRKVVSLICGFMTIAVVTAPVSKLKLNGFGEYVTLFEFEAANYETIFLADADAELKAVIESKTAAYILDKTGISATVTAIAPSNAFGTDGATVGAYPIPYSVLLDAQYDADASCLMEADLGIPSERQVWLPEL